MSGFWDIFKKTAYFSDYSDYLKGEMLWSMVRKER
jgi:hypothetical protein